MEGYKVGDIFCNRDNRDETRHIITVTDNYIQLDDYSIYDKNILHLRAGNKDAIKYIEVL